MLLKLHLNAITPFTSRLNRIFPSSEFPSSWKLAVIIPLLKPLKDPSNPLSYRPISLLSTLSKILERILNKRLTWFLESNNFLNEAQYGCRRGRSSTMALAELDAHIHTATSTRCGFAACMWILRSSANKMGLIGPEITLKTSFIATKNRVPF